MKALFFDHKLAQLIARAVRLRRLGIKTRLVSRAAFKKAGSRTALKVLLQWQK